MVDNFFKVLRPGINTTFQDKGRDNLYHIGIPFSGAMDNRNYLLANKLVGNKLDTPVIEFAYQGPLLKFYGLCERFYNIVFILFKNRSPHCWRTLCQSNSRFKPTSCHIKNITFVFFFIYNCFT